MAITVTLTVLANNAALDGAVLDSGEALSTQQIADALLLANYLFDSWSSDETMILASLRTTQTLTASVQAYTIGTGQNWNMARPVAIASAHLLNSSGPGVPIAVVDEKTWAQLPDRQSLSYAVRNLFYDRGNPTGNCYVSPVPQGSGLSVELITWVPLPAFVDATTARTMEPAYARLLQKAMAMEMCTQYKNKPSDSLVQSYKESLGIVKALNMQRIGPMPQGANA